MTNIIAIFPEDRPRFVVGADDFLDNKQPFFAVHARSSSICLTYHNVSRAELQALAERITAFLADTPEADAAADAEAACAEARQVAMSRFDQLVADIVSMHTQSPTGQSPA